MELLKCIACRGLEDESAHLPGCNETQRLVFQQMEDIRGAASRTQVGVCCSLSIFKHKFIARLVVQYMM